MYVCMYVCMYSVCMYVCKCMYVCELTKLPLAGVCLFSVFCTILFQYTVKFMSVS